MRRSLLFIIFGAALLAVVSALLVRRAPVVPPSKAIKTIVAAGAASAFGALTADSVTIAPGREASGGAANDTIAFPAPVDAVSYRFLPPPSLPDLPATTQVLSWRKQATPLTDLLNVRAASLFDFTRAPGSTLENLSFSTKDGYRVEMNFSEGALSFTDTDLREAVREASPKSLNDAEVITIANRFLDTFGIAREGYGKPSVEKADVLALDLGAPAGLPAPKGIPAQANVSYPLVLDGRRVLTSWGGDQGITVSVDTARQRVVNAYSIRRLSFEQSPYTASLHEQFLHDLAVGGFSGFGRQTSGTVKDVQLGQAELVFATAYRYDESSASELLVPAYLFSAINPPDGAPTQIIVPLLPNLLNAAPETLQGQGVAPD